MQYRKFGRLEWEVSALGFGCMRLPTKNVAIDEKEATQMLHYAVEHGVNYVDTAYAYHNGQSEPFVGRALKGAYRAKVKLATKLPSWLIHEAADFDRYFNEQLERLQTDMIDFYLLHALNDRWWPKLKELGVLDWLEKQMRHGRIGYAGFSFHDNYPVFEEIIDAYEWTFCQIQYNYMNITHQAGLKGLRYAASKGIAIVVMEPLLGGNLVNPPAPIQVLWNSAETPRTPVDWALQWVWNHPEVAVALSGMSTFNQTVENVESAERSVSGVFTEAELRLVDQARKKYQTLQPIPCTGCGYCLPCPQGVAIPVNFDNYNKGLMYDNAAGARGEYTWMAEAHRLGIAPVDGRAVNCIQCGICEEKCPQNIPISQWMPVVHNVLGDEKPYQAAL